MKNMWGAIFFKFLHRALVAVLLFHPPPASANDAPLPGQLLPKNARSLIEWEPGIYRVEIVNGDEEGNHRYGQEPQFSFRIIETIRPCRDPIGDPRQPITAKWIGNQDDFSKYAEEGRMSEWETMRIRSPAAGNKAIIMYRGGMLSQDGFWADTEENLNTARTYQASRPMNDRFAEFAFYGALIFPFIGLALVQFRPRTAMGIVLAGWASAYINEASIGNPLNIRIDMLYILPCAGLGIFVFILASWAILQQRHK